MTTATKEADAPLLGEIENPVKTPAKAAKKTAVTTLTERMPTKTPATDPTGMIALIREIAMNPDVDVDKMKAVLDMQERILDRTAKAEFDAALADMQPELPTIDQRGRIEIREKTSSGERDGEIQQSTKFAKFEDINEAIRPIIGKHGFAVSFRTGLTEDGKVKVDGILSHRAGHREQTTFVLPHDSTGSKNAVQAIGSSTSYGKRYALCALLNISSRGEDDDGLASGDQGADEEKITGDQELKLIDAIEDCGIGRPKFCTHYKVEAVAQLPSRLFDEAMRACTDYKAKKAKK